MSSKLLQRSILPELSTKELSMTKTGSAKTREPRRLIRHLWTLFFVSSVLLLGLKLGFEFGAQSSAMTPEERHMAAGLREAREMFSAGVITREELIESTADILGIPAAMRLHSHAARDGAAEEEFPVVQGVNFSPEKHPLQGGSLLRSSCPHKMPYKKVVFIKTHKTASSTITNLLHRFGYKYGLNFALPKDNMFYGWPLSGEATEKAVAQIGLYKPPFDVFGSGHSVLSDRQEKLVPFARYITILRSPVSHFRSSYQYWMAAENIARNRGPPSVTPAEFLADTSRFEPLLDNSYLIHNSFAFDLGLNPKDVDAMEGQPTKIQAFIDQMDRRFSTVLISDYLIESLLVLKREMCWPLEDVVYGAMKVTTPETLKQRYASTEEQDPLYAAVRQYNWLDAVLYDHFNETLWKKIEAQKATGWDEELAELRSRINTFTKQCKGLDFQDEDKHRSALEKDTISDEERLCHLSFTDSKGYCKTLKREQGAPIDVIECYAQRRQANVALVRMANTADEALFGLIARASHLFGYRLSTANVLNDRDYVSLRVPQSYQALHNDGPSTMLGINGLRYERLLFDQLAGPRYTMVLLVVQHPVQEFFDTWEALDVSYRLGQSEGQPAVSMAEFFRNPSRSRLAQALEVPLEASKLHAVARHGFCGQLLVNRLACRLGMEFAGDPATNPSAATAMADQWYKKMSPFIIAPLMVEEMVESVVLMRQLLCWRTTDMSFLNAALWKAAKLQPQHRDSPLRAQIENFLAVDVQLYGTLMQAFQRKKRCSTSFCHGGGHDAASDGFVVSNMWRAS
eukprot:INCI12799.1.p1 GENE.INCI12799.1~~INCI12799.1.p1  ORF type:complete len:798 (+),score=123.87 INCI12799.1:88-2481(+)